MNRDENDVWYENGRGLLFPGWYGVRDCGPRHGPFETQGEAEAALDDSEDDVEP